MAGGINEIKVFSMPDISVLRHQIIDSLIYFLRLFFDLGILCIEGRMHPLLGIHHHWIRCIILRLKVPGTMLLPGGRILDSGIKLTQPVIGNRTLS